MVRLNRCIHCPVFRNACPLGFESCEGVGNVFAGGVIQIIQLFLKSTVGPEKLYQMWSWSGLAAFEIQLDVLHSTKAAHLLQRTAD